MISNNGLLDQLDKFEEGGMSSDHEKNYILKEKERKFKEYNKLMVIGIVLLCFILFYTIDYAKFITLIGKNEALDSDSQDFVVNFKQKNDSILSTINTIFPFLSLGTSQGSLPESIDNQSGNTLQSSVNDYLQNPGIGFVEKKEGFNTFMTKFSDGLKGNETAIKKVKADIGVYGFLPREIDTVVSDNSLQRSILGVEAIKLYSALTIFSKMDSFLNNFATFLGVSPDALNDKLGYYLSRGEADIQRYLTDCALNPYQNGKCNKSGISDFENFYSINNLEQEFNSAAFKNLMIYLSQTLESDAFPKLSILVNNIDPVKNQIGFLVDINTFPDDEKALANKNILNPHIYIASLLMNLLRKSSFISGRDLSFDSLKVAKVNYNIGNNSVDVNSSNFNFTVLIKKSVEREIYDYFYGN